MGEYTLIAKTFAGLEKVLAEEINSIGGKEISTGIRSVFFKGDKAILYKANYFLRTALRILKQFSSFKFRSVDDFYKKCKNFDWLEVMNEDHTFAIYSTVFNSREFKNSMFASLKVKDAIVDFFRAERGRRPSVDTIHPDIIINVHISGDQCSLTLDSSGESLHKRGYRVAQGDAPLSEVLAAGMILLSGWKGETDFFDPMCGSGTLPIEAALIARNIPPGSFRNDFAFMRWHDFDSVIFESIQNSIQKKEFKKNIFASDLLTRNIGYSKANARRAKVFDLIKFEVNDFKDVKSSFNGATLMINPPYGERLSQKNLDVLYSMIGERLKHKYPGNCAWILSSSRELLNKVALKPTRSLKLFNGSLNCSFREYELFAGKRNIV